MLVVDYRGGEPLDRLIREPMEIGQFLRVSVALSGVVGQLHGRGVIHKVVSRILCKRLSCLAAVKPPVP